MAERTASKNKVRTEVWAHRGASGWDRQYAPENTMPAFIKAVEMGADGIELDVQMTRDKEIVICHDERIDRTSRGKGWLKDYTLAELKKIDFSKPHAEYGFVEIPTLKEFLEFAKTTTVKVNIELKTGALYYEGLEEKTFRMVEDFGLNARVIYSSFNHYSLEKLKRICPEAKIGLLMGQDTVRIPDYPRIFGAEAMHPPEGIVTQDYVDKCHVQGLKVNTWTVDNPERMREIIKMGVDAFITDCPDNGKKAVSLEREKNHEVNA
ncbi:MAG: glycerophosphodiester phosphodiesterase [Selenomonas sp.]|nr:glycerophosphodiester phosphodiesterase [Selenomonas sp.]